MWAAAAAHAVKVTMEQPKRAVPKSDIGRIPPEPVQQGASPIHSADDRLAPDTVEVLLKDFPVVTSSMVAVNSFLPL